MPVTKRQMKLEEEPRIAYPKQVRRNKWEKRKETNKYRIDIVMCSEMIEDV